jgi:hypothetical protein
MRLTALAFIKRHLRLERPARAERRTSRLYVVGPTAKLIRGSVGPEADWHGRYEAGR